AAQYEKSRDTLDVWFDSGSTHYTVLRGSHQEETGFPAHLYLEGSDQHRGWFHSSLLVACMLDGIPPYKALLTHGFVVDGGGRKMSKSKGNVIVPQEVSHTLGAEILRLWVASTDYSGELFISNEILKHVVESYRRVRNTLRFLLANTADFAAAPEGRRAAAAEVGAPARAAQPRAQENRGAARGRPGRLVAAGRGRFPRRRRRLRAAPQPRRGSQVRDAHLRRPRASRERRAARGGRAELAPQMRALLALPSGRRRRGALRPLPQQPARTRRKTAVCLETGAGSRPQRRSSSQTRPQNGPCLAASRPASGER